MSAGSAAQRPHKLGGHSGGETPLPIPNREVKPASADGTRRAISRESRTPPIFFQGPAKGPFLGRLGRRASFSRQAGSSSRSRRTRSPSGGCVTKSAASPSSANGFDRVERLGRRARLEGDEPHRLLEPEQRVGEAVRRVAELGRVAVGLVLAVRREQRGGRTTPRAARARRGSRAGSSRRSARSSMIAAATTAATVWVEDVAVAQVGDLVRDDPLELRGRRDAEQARRDRQRRAAPCAAAGRRARAGSRRGSGRAAAGSRRRATDERVRRSRCERRRLGRQELARADHPHRDPVGVPVEHRRRAGRSSRRRAAPAGSRRAASRSHPSADRGNREDEPDLEQVARDGDAVAQRGLRRRRRARPARLRPAPAAASRARARRSGSSSGATRCSGAG